MKYIHGNYRSHQKVEWRSFFYDIDRDPYLQSIADMWDRVHHIPRFLQLVVATERNILAAVGKKPVKQAGRAPSSIVFV